MIETLFSCRKLKPGYEENLQGWRRMRACCGGESPDRAIAISVREAIELWQFEQPRS